MENTAGSPSGPRRRGRPKADAPEARRDFIVACAYEAFVEAGFLGTTMEAIATRARVSKRTLYELFANKVDLFAAVVMRHRHLVLDLPRPPGEPGTPLQKLERVFRLDLNDEQDDAREALLSLIVREAVHAPELSDFLYENGIIRFREDLIDWLDAEARSGTLVVDDAALCAGMLMDVVFGALLPRRRDRSRAGRGRRKEDIRRRLAIFLKGAAKEG